VAPHFEATGLPLSADSVDEIRHVAVTEIGSLLAAFQDAIASKGLDGTVTSWNAAAERTFGYSAEETIGRPIMTIIPQSHRHEEDMILARI
jgi:PAS domain-containing protein